MKQLFICIAFLAVGCSAEAPSTDKPASATDSKMKLAPGPHPTSDPLSDAEFAEVLTTGSWVKDLGDGPFSEQWAYRFYKDGTYTQQIFSDFTSSPVEGTWTLTRTEDALQKLTLSGLDSKEYYWLGEESFVRYDRTTDSLVVTGPRYAGEQLLRHESRAQVNNKAVNRSTHSRGN